jgi:F1F0 ATPase subunit 2
MEMDAQAMIPSIDPPTLALAARTAAALAIGFLAGLGFFSMLWRATQMLVAGGSPWRTAAVHFLRLALVVCVFGLAASQGSLPLVAAAVGLTAARYVAVRRIGAR